MGREIDLKEALWRVTQAGAVNEVSMKHTAALVAICGMARARIAELEATLQDIVNLNTADPDYARELAHDALGLEWRP